MRILIAFALNMDSSPMRFVNNEFFESQNMLQVVVTRDTAPTRARDTVGVVSTRDTGVVTRDTPVVRSSY